MNISSFSQSQTGLIGEWWFWPDYTLEGKARNVIGPVINPPTIPINAIKSATYPFVFFGNDPSERIEDFIPSGKIPTEEFSIELWMLYHVTREVGAMVTYREKHKEADPKWLLGLSGREVIFVKEDSSSAFSANVHHKITDRGWKNYWFHIVGSYDGSTLKLYVNGELVGSDQAGGCYPFDTKDLQLEVAGYLSNEPYMQLGDLLKNLRIYSTALSAGEVKKNFTSFQELVVSGHLYPGLFHFTAGPYLQAVTSESIGITWETSQPAKVEIKYGTSVPLREKVLVDRMRLNDELHQFDGKNIGKYVLNGLKPDQNYFYQIVATSESGETIDSGISTFKTAPDEARPFTFCVIGDTEARPHINSRVARLMWDERPDFLVNLGDLTDGGKEDHKFQWNYEYFHGMNQLTSRVPVFPVAGNGEGDLFWFRKYHLLGEERGYYKFSYGNADFFMLDSNQKDEFGPGGEQYQWLARMLQESTAEWKFVAHHHAPYSSDDDDYGDTYSGASENGDLAIRRIVPLYEQYGVDVVMFGHLHTYQRTHRIQKDQINNQKGVLYVQAGGAGGNLEDFAPTRSWFSAKTFRGHHYLTVEVSGPQFELRMYDSEGRLKDIFQLDKSK